jgi:hypothetical protein
MYVRTLVPSLTDTLYSRFQQPLPQTWQFLGAEYLSNSFSGVSSFPRQASVLGSPTHVRADGCLRLVHWRH